GRANAERNLLFGVLAAGMGLGSRDALVSGMHAWVLDKSRSLGQILAEQGALSGAPSRLLRAFAKEHLSQHDDDHVRSLRAITSSGSTWGDVRRISDPELGATLTRVVASGPDGATDSSGRRAVGAPTAAASRFRIIRPHAQGGLGRVSLAR